MVDHVAPGVLAGVGADGPGRQGGLPGLDVLRLAQQVIDDPGLAEAFAEPLHRRQRLLGRDGGVEDGGRVEAQVADAAAFGALFPEIAAHGLGAADGAVQHGEQLAGLADLHRLDLFGHGAALKAFQRPGDVGGAVQGDAVGGLAVAAGPADLLPVGLQRAGRIGVNHETDVGLVDPHAEGDGRHHDRSVLSQEPLQPAVAVAGVHAGVIGDGVGSGLAQGLGHSLAAVAAAAIDHAGLAAPLAHQIDDGGVGAGPRGAFLADRRELEIGPGEAVDHHLGVVQPQRADDVIAGAGVGRGGDGDTGNARKQLGQPAQGPVIRTEIMSPLRDTVGLVDGDQAQRQIMQPVDQMRLRQSLG